MTQQAVVAALLRSHGSTYAEDAGIRLRDTPQPLYQLIVLALLLSAPIRAGVAVSTARALNETGLRNPRRMAAATWQQRVDALDRGGYRRYDESTATQLADGAHLLTRRWHADPRRMRAEADGDVPILRHLLQTCRASAPPGRTSSSVRYRRSGPRWCPTSTPRHCAARSASVWAPTGRRSPGWPATRAPPPWPRRSYAPHWTTTW